jgi:imidazolonepropionase-like amidohydrolase
MEGKIGTLQEGAFADMILINGDPLKDLTVLQNQGRDISLIMKAGHIFKNTLAA